MGEVDSRAPTRMGEADPLVEYPEVAAHLWVASVYLSQGQLEDPRKRSGLQGPWLEWRDPGGSLQPEALGNLSSQLTRSIVLPDEDRPSISTCRPIAPPSWLCSR